MSKNRPAFTLIEVLVTLAISSMILLIGTVAMKFMVTSLAKNMSTLPARGLIYSQIRSVVASTFPYVIYSKKTFDPNRYDYRFFYEGDEKKVLFATESPLFSNRLSIVELTLDNHRLIYKESSLYGDSSNYLAPSIGNDAQTVVLMDNLDSASFSYETDQSSASKISGEIPNRIKLTYTRDHQNIEYYFGIQNDYKHYILHVRRRLENI
ncbi:MAG: type II secretion system protein J [Sulfuricurvum sp.]